MRAPKQTFLSSRSRQVRRLQGLFKDIHATYQLRVRTHNQYMTVAARAQAEMNRIEHRS